MLDDERVGFKNGLADPRGNAALLGEESEIIDRTEDVESACFAQLEVIGPVARRDVHAAGAGVHRHEVGGQDGRRPVEERMARDSAFEGGTGKGLRFALRLPSGFGAERCGAIGSKHEGAGFSVLGEGLCDVVMFRADRDGQVGRESPWRGGPDDHAGVGGENRAGGDFERNVDGGGFFVFVFHFGFGQGGLRAVGPKDGAFAAIDKVFFDEDGEGAEDVRLIGRIEGQVGVLPVPENAEAAELLALKVDVFASVGLGALADLHRGETGFFFDHFEFDGEPVAVPTGDERRAEAGHGL